MEEDPQLEEIIEDFKARQSRPGAYDFSRKACYISNSSSKDGSSEGVSYAVAFFFLGLAIALFAFAYVKDFENGSILACIVGLVPLAASLLMFRGLRRSRHEPK